MALGQTDRSHLQAFGVYNDMTALKQGTREIFSDQVIFCLQELIEPQMWKNSRIVSNDTSVSGGMISNFNPIKSYGNVAGSYTIMLQPKSNSTKDKKMIEDLGQVKFRPYASDRIDFYIDQYKITDNTILDRADNNSWLASNIEQAITTQLNNDLVSYINYGTYDLYDPTEIAKVDAVFGKKFMYRDNLQDKLPRDIGNAILEDAGSLYALPNDKYVFGIYRDELVCILEAMAQIELLKEKLRVVEGIKLGDKSPWYKGLPYDGNFGGLDYKISKWINSRESIVENKKRYIIQPRGQFSPLLFHIPENGFLNFMEIVPFTGNTVGMYSLGMWGWKIEPQLAQYIRMGVDGDVTIWEGLDVKNFKVNSKLTTIDSFTISGEIILEEDDVLQVKALGIGKNDIDSAKWKDIYTGLGTSSEESIDDDDEVIPAVYETVDKKIVDGLKAETQYTLLFRVVKTAGTQEDNAGIPKSDTNGQTFKFALYPTTK